MEFISFILAWAILILPGLWVCNRLTLFSPHEWIPFSFTFSMVGTGFLAYLGSFFFPIQAWMVYAFAGISIIAVAREWHLQKWKITRKGMNIPLKQWVPIAGLLVIGLLLLMNNARFESISYDSVSYHQPFIDWMAEGGQFPSFDSPQNVLEIRTNSFPKLYEALWGTIQKISPLAAQTIPVGVFIGMVFMLFALTHALGHPSFLASVLFVAGGSVLPQFVTDYTDVFITLICLGALYFLTVHRENKHSSNIVGFLAGSLLAVKLTAPLLLAGLALVILAYHREWLWREWKKLMVGFALGILPVLLMWATIIPKESDLGWLPGSPATELFGASAIVYYIHFLVFLGGLIQSFDASMWSVILLFLASFWVFRKKNPHTLSVNEKRAIQWVIVALVPVLFFAATILIYQRNSFLAIVRYNFFFFAIAAVLFAVLLERITKSETTLARKRAWLGIFLIITLFFASFAIARMNDYTYKRENHLLLMDRTLEAHTIIPPNAVVFVANTPNPIMNGFSYQTLWDFTTFHNPPPADACAFLKTKGVTHVVVFFPGMDRPELGEMNTMVETEASEGKCGTEIERIPEWLVVYVMT